MSDYNVITASYGESVLSFVEAQFSLQKQVSKLIALGGTPVGGLAVVKDGTLTHLCQAVVQKSLDELTDEERKRAADYLKSNI